MDVDPVENVAQEPNKTNGVEQHQSVEIEQVMTEPGSGSGGAIGGSISSDARVGSETVDSNQRREKSVEPVDQAAVSANQAMGSVNTNQHEQQDTATEAEKEKEKEPDEKATTEAINALNVESDRERTSTPEKAAVAAAAATAIKSKRKRLPQDVIGRLQDELEDDVHDVSAWRSLISELRQQNKLDEIRSTFERVLQIYPSSAEMWISYITVEMDNGEFGRAEELFKRCLTKVPDIGLWTLYLGYILRRNNVNRGNENEEARITVTKAYEFVLENIGADINSGKLWMQFIDFIKSRPASSSWEEQQTMDLLRKTYRQATSIPLKKDDLERLWSDYSTFENNLNRATARKFLGERSPLYMKARSAAQELENIHNGLTKDTTPGRRRWTVMEVATANKWKRWIDWEKANFEEFSDSQDKSKATDRVKLAYKQSLMTLRFYPELWFEAAVYSVNKGDVEEGADILHLGLEANPSSFLVALRLAQFYELEARYDDMHTIFGKLIASHKKERENLVVKLAQCTAEAQEVGGAGEEDGTDKIESAEMTDLKQRLEKTDKIITNAYVQYMRAVKRSQGLKEARQVFKEGRSFVHSTYELYVDAAMMEHRNKQSKVAGKVFEIGLKKFGDDSKFVQTYFDFLISIDDETNARALFEKSVIRMDKDTARPLFKHFLQYESRFGDVQALSKLEQRYSEQYKDESELELFCDRYRSTNTEVDPIEEVDFGGVLERARTAEKGTGGLSSASSGRALKRLRELSPDSVIPESILSLLASLPAKAYYGDGHVFDINGVLKVIADARV